VTDTHYDFVVIDSRPGGQKAAIAAAKLSKHLAAVERRHMMGGACISTGTIPSKTMREAVLYLTGLNMRDLYGRNYSVKDNIMVADLLAQTTHVIGRGTEVIRNHPTRNHIVLLQGTARFLGANTHRGALRRERHRLGRHGRQDRCCGGCASSQTALDQLRRATRGRLRRHPDDRRVPRSMVVVGAGVIGIGYASMFAALGTKVTIAESRESCSTLRFRGRGGVEVPPTRPVGVLPAGRDGSARGRRRRGHGDDIGQWQANTGRHGDVPAGRQGATTRWNSRPPAVGWMTRGT
jgi:NAD(P) transhydrogenase